MSECINAHTNQSQLISFDQRIKIRQTVSYRGEKYSLTKEQTWALDKYNIYGYIGSSRMPKNEDVLGTFGFQGTSKSLLGEWNDQ